MNESYILDYHDGDKCLFLRDPLTNAIVEKMVASDVNALSVDIYEPWENVDISAMNQFLVSLTISDRDTPLEFINELPNLRRLSIPRPGIEIDFSRIQKLEECSLSEYKKLPEELAACRNLKILNLYYCAFKSIDDISKFGQFEELNLVSVRTSSLRSVCNLKNLRSFSLNRSKEPNLQFLSSCHRLEGVQLMHMSSLESIEGIESLKKLNDFGLSACFSLEDVSPLAQLGGLNRVLFESCPNLKTLRPLIALKNLNKLLLWENTKVKDGDLKCLLSLPKLEEYIFKNRRHYNLKQDEAIAILEKRASSDAATP